MWVGAAVRVREGDEGRESRSRRRSDSTYLDLQIFSVFPETLLSDRDSVYSREDQLEILRTPRKTCLICTGTPVKTCWKF